MDDPTNPLWPAGRGKGLLHGHVSHGLKPSHGAIAGVIGAATADGTIVTVAPPGGDSLRLVVARPALLHRTLARDDLTRLGGKPLVLLNPGAGVLAIAHGPAEAPARITVSLVSREIDGEAVEAIGGEGQPDWILLAVAPAPDPPSG